MTPEKHPRLVIANSGKLHDLLPYLAEEIAPEWVDAVVEGREEPWPMIANIRDTWELGCNAGSFPTLAIAGEQPRARKVIFSNAASMRQSPGKDPLKVWKEPAPAIRILAQWVGFRVLRVAWACHGNELRIERPVPARLPAPAFQFDLTPKEPSPVIVYWWAMWLG